MLENASVEIYLPSYVKFETKCIFATFLGSTKRLLKGYDRFNFRNFTGGLQ